MFAPPTGKVKKQTAHGEGCVKGFSDMGSIPIISTKKDRQAHLSLPILFGGVNSLRELSPANFKAML